MNKNIFLSGYWATNFGDDLFVKIICERYPEYRFNLETTKAHGLVFNDISNLSVHNKKDNIFFHIKNRVTNNYLATSNYFKLYNIIPTYIELGGSIFMMPANKSNKRALNKRKHIRKIAQNYLVIGSNFGPYFYEEQVNEYQSFFNSLNGTVFRDTNSLELFSEVSNISLASDVVFNLNISKYIESYSNNTVVISVINTNKNKIAYESFLSNSIINFIGQGKKIVLMSFCKQQGDLKFAKNLVKNLPSKYKVHVRLFNHENIDDSLFLLSQAELIIATRFHAMILGWLFKKPTFVISYSSKTTNVINDIFSEQRFIEIEDISTNHNGIGISDFSIISDEKLKNAIQFSKKQFEFLDKLQL